MFELAPVDAGDCVQLTIIILHYCISVSTLMAVELHQLPASQPGTLSLSDFIRDLVSSTYGFRCVLKHI